MSNNDTPTTSTQTSKRTRTRRVIGIVEPGLVTSEEAPYKRFRARLYANKERHSEHKKKDCERKKQAAKREVVRCFF